MSETEYEFESQSWDKTEETVSIPDEAVGLTVDYFGKSGVARYLIPVNEGE